MSVTDWFNQRLTADGWTETDAASTINSGTFALAWGWTKGKETFTVSVYSEAGRNSLYQHRGVVRATHGLRQTRAVPGRARISVMRVV